MFSFSVEPFFLPPKLKGCCTYAATLASCDDKDISAALLLPGVAREDRLSVEGIVSSEDEATPVAMFVGRMGVTPMRLMGGGYLIVFGDGVLLLLPARALNKTYINVSSIHSKCGFAFC
jgi:hypothetical protein